MDKVTGFGAINWDIIAKTKKFAKKGQEVPLEQIWERPGGSAANTISWLSKYSDNLSYVGAVGKDRKGSKILDLMNKNKIDTSQIISRDNKSTGTAISLLDKENERTLYTYGGAGSDFNPQKISINEIEKSKIIHSSSFLSKELLDYQKKLSKLENFFSFAPGFLCNNLGIKELKPIFKNTKVLFINKSEIMGLFDEKTIKESIESLINIGVSEIAVTLGEKGCLVGNENRIRKIDAEKVDVVDSTGAGDAFAAGYLLGLLMNKNLTKRANYGIKLASECIKQIGGSYYGQIP